MKVRCANCTKENNKYCAVKKATVAPNKKRTCEFFILDPSKIKIPQKLDSIRRPDWYWNKSEYKKLLKEQIKAEKERQSLVDVPNYLQENAEHPLTGDLNKFMTTATKEEE